MEWIKKFNWDLGKATLESGENILIWEASDPWKLYISGKEIKDFPHIHAEDWVLAKKYAEKTIRHLYS